MMYRTTIMLPEDLKSRVVRECQATGLSLGEYIREALARSLATADAGKTEDTLLSDSAVFTGFSPSDAASSHDDYLYDGKA